MTRRTIALLMTFALGFLVAPLAAAAQPQGKIPRIGYLTDGASPLEVEAFQCALREIGYVEGHNMIFASRVAEKPELCAALAAELVGLKEDVTVGRSRLLAFVTKQATSTIPIVMATSGDAVGQGIVESLARPGGNVTGLTAISPDLLRNFAHW
jgi:putative ABC transport system substrate-binding protein